MDKMLGTKKRKASSVISTIVLTLAAPLLLILLTLSGCQTTPVEPLKVVSQPLLRCAPATDVILFLKRTFNEEPLYTGLFGNRIVLTVFVSPRKTFTVVHTGVGNEISCLVSSGENFKKINWEEKKSV
tara:strand:+ start:1010 stop:1393 length:384 start_codon:yes stop_codon:yes gene_type:complete